MILLLLLIIIDILLPLRQRRRLSADARRPSFGTTLSELESIV